MKNGKCPKCKSTDIIPELGVYAQAEQGGPIFVSLERPEPKKKPLIWKVESETTGFQAWMCGSCGYTEYYAKKPALMLGAHKKGYKSI